MLLPKRTKFRKAFKGRNDGVATRCNYLAFGDYGLQSLENERITSRQIEAARRAITGQTKRGGKGSPEYYVAKVKKGTMLFEMSGVNEDIAREAMRLAGHKLPVKTRFVKREEA